MKKFLRVSSCLFLSLFLSFSFFCNTLFASDVLTLLSPNGGEIIEAGTHYTIQWEVSSEAVIFDILYSIDDGLTWEVLENNIASTSYEWVVPDLTEDTNNCRIRITGYNSYDEIIGDDVSNMGFTIVAGY